MDFWATLRVVTRRWFVVVPAMLLTVLAVLYVFNSVPTQYESKAVILLSPPLTGATQYSNGYRPDSTNPLLNSGNGLDLTGSLLIEAMRTVEFGHRVGLPVDGSVDATVNNGTANPELLTQGPFVFVQVDARNPVLAQDLVRRMVDAGRDELQARQTSLGAPPSTFVTYNVIVAATEPIRMRGNRIRAAGAAAALGMILCLASAFAADSLLQARSRRRRRTKAESTDAPTQAAGDPVPDAAPQPVRETVPTGRG